MIKGRSSYVLKAHTDAESGVIVLAGTNAEQGLIARCQAGGGEQCETDLNRNVIRYESDNHEWEC
jgi:hypothetical protein